MKGLIDKIETSCLIDSGSAVSIIKFNKTLNDQIRKSEIQFLRVANGEKIPIEGQCEKSIKIGNIDTKFPFLICKHITADCIIGIDFLKKHNCSIEFSNDEIKLVDKLLNSEKDNLEIKKTPNCTNNSDKVK